MSALFPDLDFTVTTPGREPFDCCEDSLCRFLLDTVGGGGMTEAGTKKTMATMESIRNGTPFKTSTGSTITVKPRKPCMSTGKLGDSSKYKRKTFDSDSGVKIDGGLS